MTTVSPVAQSQGSAAFQRPAQGIAGLTASDFLELLIAQVKNQNPLNPVSASQFMSQTAQLSTLEQIANLSQETGKLLAAEQFSSGLSAVGKTVTGVDTSGKAVTGVVSSVTLGTSGPVLHVGSSLVPLSSLRSVA